MAQEVINSSSTTADKALFVEDDHRGIVNDAGEVVATCSTDYLLSLALEVLRAKASPMVKLTKYVSTSDQISRLQFVSTETRRLFRNPDLFPSDPARVRFAALLALDSDLQFIEAVKELLLVDLQDDLNKYNRKMYTRPCYKDGSKGWENFLLNMGPGAPKRDEPLETTPKSAYQLIPTVGLRIVGDANREEQGMSQWIQQNPNLPKIDPAATTKLALLNMDDPENDKAIPDISICQQSDVIYHSPNPFREDLKIRLDIPVYGPEPLEEYSLFIGRLDSNPLPNNLPIATLTGPTIFPMISLRSWKPPTKLTDLKYH